MLDVLCLGCAGSLRFDECRWPRAGEVSLGHEEEHGDAEEEDEDGNNVKCPVIAKVLDDDGRELNKWA